MAKKLYEYDYNEIHRRACELMDTRKHFKRSAIAEYMNYFDTKCVRSKAAAEEAKKYIPGGIQHNLANSNPFPLAMERGEGPYLYDIDGNRYIDLLCAGGPLILGNNYPALRDATAEQILKNGPVTGLFHNYETELAKLVCQYVPSVERYRMLASGTEGDIIAIRLARAYTGKKHIIRILSGYHGWSDQLVYSFNGETEMKAGIPVECFHNTHAVPVNDIEALEACIEKYENDGGVAAFIMEAIGQDSGIVPTTKEYHKEAERICREHGMLLIYDEVVTSFRLGMAGVQEVFGTSPDLIVFGKVIGGGYGCSGGIGGKAEIMDMLAAGISAATETKVKVGGTISANPLSALAGITVLKELVKENVHEKLQKAADEVTEGIAEIADKHDVPALVFNHGSILHVDTHGIQHIPYCIKDPAQQQVQLFDAYKNYVELSMALLAEGVVIANGGKTYLSYPAIDVLDDILAAYDRVFSNFE